MAPRWLAYRSRSSSGMTQNSYCYYRLQLHLQLQLHLLLHTAFAFASATTTARSDRQAVCLSGLAAGLNEKKKPTVCLGLFGQDEV
jgi:hypothetical protein